jgi:murein DD-endopeptidase MepM/ murein hydrolase activator NlpD
MTPAAKHLIKLTIILIAFATIPNVWGQATPTPQPAVLKVTSLQIDSEVRPAVGQFVPADDDVQHLVYELFMVNWQKENLRLASIDIEDAATGKLLGRYDTKALEDPMRIGVVPFSSSLEGPPNRVLPAGRTAVITIHVRLPLGASVPAAVRHRIRFESDPNLRLIRDDGSESSELFAVSEPMPIDRRPPVVLGPPLRGGPWFCANALFDPYTPHDTQTAYARTARIRVVSRFGCDFAKIAKVNGEITSWKPQTPVDIPLSAFYGYGADVLAVADGRIVQVKDGIPENLPRTDRKINSPVPVTEATVNGNMIALKIGKGQYAYYVHLQPGSIRVKEGDPVRKGQVLAKLGNSGNTDGPHLHFHVGSGPRISEYEFLPYVFPSYWLDGRGGDFPAKRKLVERKMPTRNSIITFPER